MEQKVRKGSRHRVERKKGGKNGAENETKVAEMG